ncbi:hypothetical protein DFW26_16705 [Clostridioides difficile]|nr:hypothetical protein [Clostridioides difficile]
MIICWCIGKALIQTEEFCKFRLYPHLLTYEKIIKIFMSFYEKKYMFVYKNIKDILVSFVYISKHVFFNIVI